MQKSECDRFAPPNFSPFYEGKEQASNAHLLFYTGKIKVAVDPTQFNGIESIPAAVEYLLSGKNCGKVVVKFYSLPA